MAQRLAGHCAPPFPSFRSQYLRIGDQHIGIHSSRFFESGKTVSAEVQTASEWAHSLVEALLQSRIVIGKVDQVGVGHLRFSLRSSVISCRK